MAPVPLGDYIEARHKSRAPTAWADLSFYRGASQIDGTPIVGIATVGNRKTGSMIQTWIIRDDVHPVASRQSVATAFIVASMTQMAIALLAPGRATSC
jgi:hypothetical protein